MSDTLYHLGSILYHSEPSDVPYSPNQFLGWDFFVVSYSKTALVNIFSFHWFGKPLCISWTTNDFSSLGRNLTATEIYLYKKRNIVLQNVRTLKSYRNSAKKLGTFVCSLWCIQKMSWLTCIEVLRYCLFHLHYTFA